MYIVEILKALADETRMRILNLLFREPFCVCELEEILKLSQSNASRHITKLKNAKLIVGNKQAQWIYYRLNEEVIEKHSFLKELLSREMENDLQCQKDLVRLKKYRELGGSCESAVKIEEDF